MAQLPEKFLDLEKFVDKWAKPTEYQRNQVRLQSSIEEIKIFYDALLARMDDIVAHLNQFKVGPLPEPEQNLYYLALAFMEVSPAVECFHQPIVTPLFPPERFEIVM